MRRKRKSNSYTSGGRLLVTILLVGTCIGCAVVAFAARAYIRSTEADAGSHNITKVQPISRPSNSTLSPPPERLEIEVITILPHGFEPAEITRASGQFGIAVENRSGLEDVQLRLDRVSGNRLYEAEVPRQKLNWKQGVDLTPGLYVLTEASHPEWVCHITIN